MTADPGNNTMHAASAATITEPALFASERRRIGDEFEHYYVLLDIILLHHPQSFRSSATYEVRTL